MIGVVLDCNIILQAILRKDSAAFLILQQIEKKGLKILISRDILNEYRDVLTRTNLRKKFTILTDELVNETLEILLLKSVFQEKVDRHFELIRDPKDEPYINLAIELDAKYIVTRDLDLLTLMQDRAFANHFPALIICNPDQFLTILDAI